MQSLTQLSQSRSHAAQVSEAECIYDAPQMAELLFSDASPALVLAAHRLLRDDRALFRQV